MSDTSKYKYIKEQSILYGLEDDYSLTIEEYSYIYSFFVTYSMCNNLSYRKRTFVDYGWESNKLNSGVERRLLDVIPIKRKSYVFIDDDDNIKTAYEANGFSNGPIMNFDTERAVIHKANEGNRYLMLFRRIRNVLAHGKYILKYSSANEKMIVMQDDDVYNVTARMVLKLSTLLGIIRAVDRNNLIMPREPEEENLVA